MGRRFGSGRKAVGGPRLVSQRHAAEPSFCSSPASGSSGSCWRLPARERLRLGCTWLLTTVHVTGRPSAAYMAIRRMRKLIRTASAHVESRAAPTDPMQSLRAIELFLMRRQLRMLTTALFVLSCIPRQRRSSLAFASTTSTTHYPVMRGTLLQMPAVHLGVPMQFGARREHLPSKWSGCCSSAICGEAKPVTVRCHRAARCASGAFESGDS